MEKIKKYGKVLLGVAILGGAVLTQSFTTAVKADKKLANHFYGYDEVSQTYLEITGPLDETANCESFMEPKCVVGTDNPIPDGFTWDDAQNDPSISSQITYESNDSGSYTR